VRRRAGFALTRAGWARVSLVVPTVQARVVTNAIGMPPG
jgi:hypothetical protein